MSSYPDKSSWREQPTRSVVVMGLLLGGTAVLGGLVLAFGGPLAGAALFAALIAGLVVLRDIEVGFWGVVLVVCLLPFATLPIDIGLTPTFLDLALGAVFAIWALGLVTGRQRTVVTSPLTIPLGIFILVAVFAFIFGLSNGPLTPTLLRKFAELVLSLSFVLIVIDYCTNWLRLERLVKVVILAGAAAAALAIGLWLLPDDTANTLLNYAHAARVSGRLGHSLHRGKSGAVGTGGGHLCRPECVGRAAVDDWGADGTAVGVETAVISPLAFLWLVRRHFSGGDAYIFAQRHVWAGQWSGFYRRAALSPAHSVYAGIAGLVFLLLPVTQAYVARFR
jgi:polysaccharide biosynthesis protein PslJ